MAKACSCFSTFLFINIYKHTCIKGLIDSLDLEWKKLLALPPVSHSLRQKPLPWHRMRKECERLIRFTTPCAFHFWYFCCLYMVVTPTFLIRQRIHRCFRVPFAFELPFGLTSSDQLGTLFWPKNAGNRGQQAYAWNLWASSSASTLQASRGQQGPGYSEGKGLDGGAGQTVCLCMWDPPSGTGTPAWRTGWCSAPTAIPGGLSTLVSFSFFKLPKRKTKETILKFHHNLETQRGTTDCNVAKKLLLGKLKGLYTVGIHFLVGRI